MCILFLFKFNLCFFIFEWSSNGAHIAGLLGSAENEELLLEFDDRLAVELVAGQLDELVALLVERLELLVHVGVDLRAARHVVQHAEALRLHVKAHLVGVDGRAHRHVERADLVLRQRVDLHRLVEAQHAQVASIASYKHTNKQRKKTTSKSFLIVTTTH